MKGMGSYCQFWVPNSVKALLSIAAICFGLVLAPAHAAGTAKAAEVLYVSGAVTAAGIPLKKGDAVLVDALIETAGDGHVYMRAIDGGFLVVRANSKAAIRAYDIANQADVRIKIELIEGTARSITGTAAQQDKDGFRFNTPVAAIGVRGTDFTVQTNEFETLVSVSSGVVAVSPLTDTCLATGFGPCQGDLVVDLSNSDQGFLRVLKGESAPQLVPSPEKAPKAPIPDEKANSDEQTGDGAVAETAETPSNNTVSTQPELSPVYEEKLTSGNFSDGSNRQPTPPENMPPPAAQPEPQPQPVADSGITWGRWQQVAEASPDSELFAKAIDFNHYGLRLLGPYFLASQRDREYSRPVESQVSFVPVAHEAYLGLRGGLMQSANVSNGQLTVNFDTQKFNTEFNVANSQGQVDIRAAGSVGALGNLEGDIVKSNANFFGYLEGNGATHGTSIFSTFGDNPVSAAGSVQWAR